jgi:ABC-type uncharacterized transport system substrate-binding protein
MAPKTILALAVGDPKHSQRIDHPSNLHEVRPYISGLIDGLADLECELGTDFVIDYKQNWLDHIAKGHAFGDIPKHPALIYAMSTKVMRAAGDHTKDIPIVFPSCSEFGDEPFVKAGRATGFSARRTQTAGYCFDRFVMSVPTLKEVLILHINEHDISENALALVKAAATRKGVEPKAVLVRSHPDLLEQLSKLPARAAGTATVGVQILPVDLFFGAMHEIIKGVQAEKKLPAFFPTTDWVPGDCGGAFGGYGVTQYRCGERTAGHVHQILQAKPGARLPMTMEAAESDFEWAVSKSAGKALGIPTPEVEGLRVI